MNLDLTKLVVDECERLGNTEAAKFFDVGKATISNWMAGRNSPTLKAAQMLVQSMPDITVPPESCKSEEGEVMLWEGRKLMVLLPVYRSFNWATHFTLFANYSQFGPQKIGIMLQHATLIYEARNVLVDRFMKTDAEWCIFIDDDMVLPCGNAYVMNNMFGARLPEPMASVTTFNRLMSTESADKLILGGLYFGRGRGGKAQYAEAFERDIENQEAHTLRGAGVKPVGWVATGCMRIHRSVFDRMKAESARWPEIVPVNQDKPWGYFTPAAVGVGEDVSFCRRAAAIGIKSWVDTNIVCSHVGDEFFTHHNTKDPLNNGNPS